MVHFLTPSGLELLEQSPDCTHSSAASPQRRVVELDPQQVPHAGLGRVVDDVLVVQEGVTVATTHPGLHPGAHRHRRAVSGGTKRGRCEIHWLPGSLGTLCKKPKTPTGSICSASAALIFSHFTRGWT